MKLRGFDIVVVSEQKVSGYLLSPSHSAGRHKAVWLRAFGFVSTRWTELAAALRLHAAAHDVTAVDRSAFGIRYVLEGPLMTPDGRNPLARSVWFIEAGSDRPQFVTLYPLRRGEP